MKNGFQGGVHMCTNADEVHDFASKSAFPGNSLVTKQTGAEGKPVNKDLMERLYLRRETYFSILMDRSHNIPVGWLLVVQMVGCQLKMLPQTPERIYLKKQLISKQVFKMASHANGRKYGICW